MSDENFICPHCGKEIEAAKIHSWKAKQVGSATSEKKAISSAENGKLGGRPTKYQKWFEGAPVKDWELNVVKDGKPRKLKLEDFNGIQYYLYIYYPDGSSVRARYQPTIKEGFPSIEFFAKKNGFEI